MPSQRGALRVARPALLLVPLLLPHMVPLSWLPPAVAYLVTDGRWLIGLGALLATVSLVRHGLESAPGAGRVRGWLHSLSPRAFAVLCWASALCVMLLLIPGHRFTGDSLSGDEPKYLRLAESLYRDLDVDMGSESLAPLTPRRLAANLRGLGDSVRRAAAGLWRDEPVAAEHRWNRGNWTLAGRSGGLYYVQSPGLPLLILPGLIVQRTLMPDWGGPLFPVLTLALLWSLAFLQTTLLALEVVGSRLAALSAAAALCFSAPLFVGGYHFYPEVAAAAAVPWLLRHGLHRPPGRGSPVQPGTAGFTLGHPPSPDAGLRDLAVATRGERQTAPRADLLHHGLLVLMAGALVWLHPKFLVLSLVLLGALLLRLRSPALAVVGALPLLALLLFDHRVTGLLRPDALYQRYASAIYTGPRAFLSLDMVPGLLNALVSARDGLLIMAPAALAGVLALPLLAREQPRVAATLAAVFSSLWLAAAVHDGGAPGPPGRLMAPVACVLAVPLAMGLLRLGSWLPYRWTAALLVLLSALITLTMVSDWRRSVNPYRRMLTPETDFARDLPAGPAAPGDSPESRARGLESARGLIVVSIVALWVWICGRRSPSAPPDLGDRWRSIRNVHLAWWGTISVGSAVLRALGP